MPQAPESVLFEESQRTSPALIAFSATVTFFALGFALVGVVRSGQAAAAGTGLALGTLIALGAIVLAGWSRLDTRVTGSEAVAIYRPFPFSTIRLRGDEIAAVTPYEFGLLSMPGGIGYHIGFGWRAATARTGTGVLVTRTDGKRFLIGTQRPDALQSALMQLQRATRAPAGTGR